MSALVAETTPSDLPAIQAQFVDRLCSAHRHIEERFTAGGEALMSVMEVIGRLIGALDQLTGALDGETASAAMDAIQATTEKLAALPDMEMERGRHFGEIATFCADLENDVALMREIMRYLLSIAMTVKITGAHLPDFTEFADEIRDRTHTGSQEVEAFVNQLGTVKGQIDRACDVSDNMVRQYRKVLPGLVDDLHANNAKIAAEHRTMAALAATVRQLANGVQMKIASVLSNLQIGDITRQRIEHIRSAFLIFDAYVEETEGLSDAEIASMRLRLAHLCQHQMDDTLNEFFAGTAKVMTGMSGLTSDASSVLATRNDIIGTSGKANVQTLYELRDSVSVAHRLVSAVERSGVDAARIAATAASRTNDLLAGIGTIQQMEIDVHFMALNATLRCSKLGDAGRSVNVVSAELRTFAAALEEPARRIITKLTDMQSASANLRSDDENVGDSTISVPLQAAFELIDQTCTSVDDGLRTFAEESDNAFSMIGRSLGSVDFDTGLGDELRACLDLLGTLDAPDESDTTIAPHLATLTGRIFATYTMAQERNVHLAHFPPSEAAQTEAETVKPEAASDDDDLDDMFF